MAKRVKFEFELGGNLKFLTLQKSEFFKVIDEKRVILSLPENIGGKILSSLSKVIFTEGFMGSIPSGGIEVSHSTTAGGKEQVLLFLIKRKRKNAWERKGKLYIYKTEKTYTVHIGSVELPPIESEDFGGVFLMFGKRKKDEMVIKAEFILSQDKRELINKAKEKIKKLCGDNIEIRIEEEENKEKMNFKWEGALKELKDKVSSEELQHISKYIKINE